MDSYFTNRTNQILLENASRGVVDYKGGKNCQKGTNKICIPVKKKKEVLALLKTLSKRSGSKAPRKAKAPAKKRVAKKKAPAKKRVAKKKAPAKKRVAKKKAPAKKRVAKKKAPAKKRVAKKRVGKKKVKGSGMMGGCADCPYCSGSGLIKL